jgi:hypothetical protein
VLWAARSTITERDRTWAPLALTGAAAAVSFGVVSTLYDELSFPHGVYIFLYTAGLVAAVVSRDPDRVGAQRRERAAPAPAVMPGERGRQGRKRPGLRAPASSGGSTSS